MSAWRRLALGAALGVATPAAARAQGGAAGGSSVLVGTVVTDSGAVPLAGAEVLVAALRRSTRAGDDGAFVLRALPAGLHVVTVRGVGFEPMTVRVRATGAAGDTIAADFALARRGVTLARVDVSGARPVRPAERARARQHGGVFLGPETLANHQLSTMSDVLRRVPGINVQRVFRASGSINTLASSRGGAPGSLRTGSGSTQRLCFYQIYVDGVRVYTPDSGDPPELDDFKVTDFEGIEIYRGAAETPPAYAGTGASCGTVLFWSRRP